MSIASLLLALPVASAGQGDGFEDLAPELQAIPLMDAEGRPRITNERVAELEALLSSFLGLPPELRARLTDAGGARRAVLGADGVRVRIARRDSDSSLFDLDLALDGERVVRRYLTFVDVDGTSPATRAAWAQTNARSRHHPLTALPLFFGRLQELLVELDARDLALLDLHVAGGVPTTDPPYAEATYTVRVADAHGTRGFEGYALLPLEPGDERRVPVDRNGFAPRAVHRAATRPTGDVLDTGLGVLRALDLPFPHTLLLRDAVWGVHPIPGDSLYLDLRRGRSAASCLGLARLWREDGAGWRVTEWTGKRRETPVPLADYVALLRAAVVAADERGETIGVVAGAGRTLLVVTTKTPSFWDADRATAFVLTGTVAGVALEGPLPIPLLEPEVIAFRRRVGGQAEDGRMLEVALVASTCGTETDPDPLVRFGAFEGVLLGGSALAAMGRLLDPRPER